MSKWLFGRLFLPAVSLLTVAGTGHAAIAAAAKKPPTLPEVRLIHDLEGPAAETLSELVVRFNQRPKAAGIVRIESRTDGADAHPEAAGLALFDASEMMRFFGTRPRLYPLDELMRKHGSPLAGATLLPLMADAVDDASGRLQALPLNLSLPVLFLNRTLLGNANVAPTPPRTWWDLQEMAGALYTAGAQCPLTTSHMAWVHLENLASQTGEPMIERQPGSERLLVNGMVSVKHLALLSSWQKSHYFRWFGPGQEADAHFLSGECAMITSASSLYVEALRRGVDVRVAPLPYYDDVYAPRAGETLPDGRSLYVLANSVNTRQEQLIVRFVRFLLEPAIQRDWVERSGSLPMTSAAIEALRDGGIFPPEMLVATKRRLSSARPKVARIKGGAARERFRSIFGEELEPVWNADRAPKEALDVTVQRSHGSTELRPRGASR